LINGLGRLTLIEPVTLVVCDAGTRAMPYDEQRISRALDLQRLSLPPRPKVDEIRWEPYVDSLGEDALRVWITLSDDTRDEDLRGTRSPIQRAIHDALLREGIDLFPYLRFATHAELAEPIEEE
jgi:hypothetical protein